jgi:hypothetical protein
MINDAAIIAGGVEVLKVFCSLLAVIIVTTILMFRANKNLLEADDEEYDIDELEK